MASTTYQRPFPVPAYLRHASLFADRFETVPSAADAANDDLARPPASLRRDDKGKGRASATDARILLPTCWDEADRCALLELTSDGLGVSFAGSAKYGDRDAAAVRANRPVPPQAGVYYYEVQVLDKGLSGYIGIGLSDRTVPLGRLPGWEDKSYGYHADDGRAFCSQGNGEEFGPTFSTGDTVGCGIDWTGAGPPRGERERAPRQLGRGKDKDKDGDKGGGRVFFTKNGKFLGASPPSSLGARLGVQDERAAADSPLPRLAGYAFCNLQGKLYPTIGLRTPNEAVRVNFGAVPFKFDIEGLVLVRPSFRPLLFIEPHFCVQA